MFPVIACLFLVCSVLSTLSYQFAMTFLSEKILALVPMLYYTAKQSANTLGALALHLLSLLLVHLYDAHYE